MASRAGTACGGEEARRWEGAAAEFRKAISLDKPGGCRSLVKIKASELTIPASDVTRRSEA
jgi:hypothetical protein